MSRARRTPQTSSGLPGCPRLRPNPSRRWSARPGVSPAGLQPAPTPVHGRGDGDADEAAGVGAVQSGDETVVEEGRRRHHVAEEVCGVDEEDTRGRAREPRGERKPPARAPLEAAKAEADD